VYLPLTRLGDLFNKYPLVKGSQMRLVLNFNSSSVGVSFTNVGPTMSLTANPTMLAGNTVTPLVSNALSSKITNGGVSAITITTQIQTTTVAGVLNTTAQRGYASLPQCRLYLPVYTINPNFEERLLTNRLKTIRYNDIYQQPILGIVNGAQAQVNLTTALPNVEMLIILPFHTNGGTQVAATSAMFQSPFNTSPATTMPGGMLAFQNFNVSVSGQNVFNNNLNFGYDDWVNEVKKCGLNAGLSRELASGLISKTTWEWSPFIIADLSRRPLSADKTFQSVNVSMTNQTGVTMDYYCFILYQKEVQIDVVTGKAERIF
jgi:hypothetical protein